MHTHLNFMFKPALYSTALVINLLIIQPSFKCLDIAWHAHFQNLSTPSR